MTLDSDTPPPSSAFEPKAWFSTPVWSRKVNDAEALNERLLAIVRELRSQEPGVVRSNVGGWHSGNAVHRRPDMATVRKLVGRTCAQCAAHLGFDFGRYDIRIDAMWFNENRKGDFNKAHLHPNSFLSGVYYVATPEGSGDIEFYDPITARQMTSFPLARMTPENSQAISYKPEAGNLLIFPSWLRHGVMQSQSDAPRVSISFNIGFVPKAAANQERTQPN